MHVFADSYFVMTNSDTFSDLSSYNKIGGLETNMDSFCWLPASPGVLILPNGLQSVLVLD